MKQLIPYIGLGTMLRTFTCFGLSFLTYQNIQSPALIVSIIFLFGNIELLILNCMKIINDMPSPEQVKEISSISEDIKELKKHMSWD